MTENDKKIRKYWLSMLSLSLLLVWVNMLVMKRYDPTIREMPETFYYWMVGSSMLGGVSFAYLLYHCAYKKPGTKLLGVCAAITLVNLISTPFMYFNGKLGPIAHVPFYKVYLVIGQIIGITWMVLCWKMRTVNLKRKSLSASPQ